MTFTDIDLPLPGRTSGKVRETWPLPGGRRLLVTTDRLSSFDRVVGAVRHKGQVLNQLSAWWCERAADLVDHHVIDVCDPNATIAVDVTPLPVEVVVRGHLTGSTSTSLWTMYAAGGRDLYGHRLPDGLGRHEELPRPIVTPTTKAASGQHDEPLGVGEVVERGLVDAVTWDRVCDVALELFDRGRKLAAESGLVLADTKYELGTAGDGRLVLIDEVHTPDSSRYWRADTLADRLAAGGEPESHDKEPIRLALRAAGFTGDGSVPELAPGVWETTSRRYVELYEAVTGEAFVPGAEPVAERLRANLRAAGVLPPEGADRRSRPGERSELGGA